MLRFVRWIVGQDAPVEQLASNRYPLPTTPLRLLGEPKNRSISDVAASVVLTATCEAVSMTCVGCNARIKISTTGTAAVVTDHRILDGERLDLGVAPGSTISVIAESAGATGNLAISELL